VSDNVARAAEGEVLAIAEGLPTTRPSSAPGRPSRPRARSAPATGACPTWASMRPSAGPGPGQVLRHMDATGEPEFCGCTCDDAPPPAFLRAVWAANDWLARATWWLNVPGYVRAFRDLLGAEPITFYEPPGQAVEERGMTQVLAGPAWGGSWRLLIAVSAQAARRHHPRWSRRGGHPAE
jgi:hypothetical protein